MKSLSDAAYKELKEKLHQVHDKIWKAIFSSPEAIREYFQKILLPMLSGIQIDLDHLELDNTNYVNPQLRGFASDLVYRTTLIDLNGNKMPIQLALLLEHKSEMPKPVQLRLQLTEYINAIQSRNYDPETDSTVFVLPNVFNQFDTKVEIKSFRAHFPQLGEKTKSYLVDYDVVLTNLPNLSAEQILAFERYGALRAGLLAMKHVHHKRFLKQYFAEIFVFLERHPNRKTLRTQLLTYMIGAISLSREELEDLLQEIFYKPYFQDLKQEAMELSEGFIAVAYREAQRETEERLQIEQAAALRLEKRLFIMRCWKRNLSTDVIAELAATELPEIKELIKGFEAVKEALNAPKVASNKQLMELSGLNTKELAALVKLIKMK